MVSIHTMKQSNSKHVKNKRASRFGKIVMIIGGIFGLTGAIYKYFFNKRQKELKYRDMYIPAGHFTNPEREIAVTKEIASIIDDSDYIEESKTVFVQLLQDILHNELSNAKKVWVMNANQEELQVDKHIFEEDGQLFLGSSNQNVMLKNVCRLKYRNKIYFDKDTIMH